MRCKAWKREFIIIFWAWSSFQRHNKRVMDPDISLHKHFSSVVDLLWIYFYQYRELSSQCKLSDIIIQYKELWIEAQRRNTITIHNSHRHNHRQWAGHDIYTFWILNDLWNERVKSRNRRSLEIYLLGALKGFDRASSYDNWPLIRNWGTNIYRRIRQKPQLYQYLWTSHEINEGHSSLSKSACMQCLAYLDVIYSFLLVDAQVEWCF